MKSIVYGLCLLFFLSACKSDDTPDPGTIPTTPEPEVVEDNPLLTLSERTIVDADGNPVYLQGVAFTNFIWEPTATPPQHHTEVDYQRVEDMGMNVIRFYMNYAWFENDANPYTYRQSGWDWLDQNIAWAKEHNLYLVLNMHAPQGGYQSQGTGDALWDDLENQNRLTSLWKEIAERYKDEEQIAGYGPVNEPVPNRSISQWNQLANRLIHAIRSTDDDHLIFIEQAIYVKGQPRTVNLNFPDVSASNIVYEFHSYAPYFYTHQLLEFAGLGEGGKYPDESKPETSVTEWYATTFNNPKLTANTSDWTFYEGERYEINDPKLKVAIPVLSGGAVGGTVNFDNIVIKEYAPDGSFTHELLNLNLNSDEGWFFWSENNIGEGGLATDGGYDDSNSLYISGTSANAVLSSQARAFIPKQGYAYEISGWMKGTNATTDNQAALKLDFYTQDGPVTTRNKAYLESTISEVSDWAKARGVALYLGEFGAGNPCFEDGKGGLQFVEDMVSIAKEQNISFTYHAYHEDAFGIYLGYGLPDPLNVNQPLIDWFTNNLK